MSEFQLTPTAVEDLDAIAEYILTHSGAVRAAKVIGDIRDGFRLLADMPGLGHYRDELLPRPFKFWAVHSFLIVYRWEVRPIQVIAVVHGARELGALLRRRAR